MSPTKFDSVNGSSPGRPLRVARLFENSFMLVDVEVVAAVPVAEALQGGGVIVEPVRISAAKPLARDRCWPHMPKSAS